MRFGSLFSGIGAMDLGLERAGMKCAWQVEIDDYCRRILCKRWPEVPKFEDVKEVGSHNLPTVDLIAGGFPCQPHSLAGKRMASSDERDLWGEFYRIICEVKPQWVLAENVAGLLSSEKGRFFGGVLRDLAEAGYDAEWHVLPAAAVGAPHIRDRVYILAYPTGVGLERGVFSKTSWEVQTKATRYSLRVGSSWEDAPEIPRVGYGASDWVDRLRCLGNAVVPAVVAEIGRAIMA